MNTRTTTRPLKPRPTAQLALAAMLGCAAQTSAATYVVPVDFPTVQDAVDGSVDGDEIVLQSLVYSEEVTITNKALTLRSQANDPSACIIESVTTGLIVNGADADVTLRGIRFRNGTRGIDISLDAKVTIENCQIRNSPNAGGVYLNGAELIMRNSEVANCSSTNVGGGVWIINGRAELLSCLFRDNSVGGFNAYGGGVYIQSVESVLIAGCSFLRNVAAGTNEGEGGGLWANHADGLTVVHSTFDDNEASTLGGGAFVEFTEATFSNVQFINNTAEGGGGLFLQNAGGVEPDCTTLSNCLLADNDGGGGSGGGLRIGSDVTASVMSTTIFNNVSASGGGVAVGPGSVGTFTNCVNGGNAPNDFQGTGTWNVTYSITEDPIAGEGNLNELPLLVDTAGGDYRPQPGSPLIDSGNTAAYAGATLDLDGNDRSVDDPDTENTGIGFMGTRIDMGCYEFQPDDAPACPADITGPTGDPDGNVDALDFLELIASWGTPACP